MAASNLFQPGDRSQLTRRPDAGIKTRSAMVNGEYPRRFVVNTENSLANHDPPTFLSSIDGGVNHIECWQEGLVPDFDRP